MTRTAAPRQGRRPWAPRLAELRLVSDGRCSALLAPDASVQWWCAPQVDDPPLCWRLLDRDGGTAHFPGVQPVGVDDAPVGLGATTRLRDDVGVLEVRDGLLTRGAGVLLVRLLRRRPGAPSAAPVEHRLRLGGFDAPSVRWDTAAGTAAGTLSAPGRGHALHVRGGRLEVRDDALVSVLDVGEAWVALVVGVDAEPDGDEAALIEELEQQEAGKRRHLADARLPRTHPGRALDALAVVRACTSAETGAVVASPTAGLPEAPGHDRQFDYRYTWLRDASLSTAVAALLGQGVDARRYLDFVSATWRPEDLGTRPVVAVRGEPVPDEREVDGVTGWAGSRPVRVGNDARDQRQDDAAGLFAEAVSVYLQVGGELDDSTWELVRLAADAVADDAPGQVRESNGIWEMREQRPFVDGDLGRWLLLDRALWIARGWRPRTRRRHWKRARDTVAERITSALDDSGLLPQAYGQHPPVPDASSLMAVAFGLLDRRDPRAHRLVDALLERLGAGPFVHRYPPGGADGFSGTEGAFLPMSFLAVTALAQLGRSAEAEERLDAMCGALPRLLSEEVDPHTGELLGNTPLVWSHAELARAVYVLDAAKRRDRWGVAGLWAWRLQRYVRLRRDLRRSEPESEPDRRQEEQMQIRQRPAGPPAAAIRPREGGIGRSTSPGAEAVSDALRRGSGSFLDDRRRTAVLQLAAAGTLAVVGLYQFGVLRSVPEPSLPGLGADRVDASGEAYALLRTPDATLGIASAAASLVLAGMGSAKRHEDQPWIPLLLAGKSVVDAAGGVYLFAEQVSKHRKVCSWCTASAALLVATVPAVLPEARAAWKAWRRR